MRQALANRRFRPHGCGLFPIGTLLALLLLSTVSAAGAQGPTNGATPTKVESALTETAKPTPAKTLRGTGVVRWGSTYSQASGYERFEYVLVGRQDASAAARLPGISLAYMSGTSIQRNWSTGVTYQDALANDWLLKDANGAYVLNVQYGAFIADIGNPAFQQRFIDNVARFLKATKADGVFIDDVIGHPLLLTHGVYPAKYPTGEAWEAAMTSFVSTVGRALKARGYYVVVNAIKYISGDTRSDTAEHVAAFWRRIGPSVNGLMSEYWLQNPNDVSQLRAQGSRWYENWRGWQSLVSVAQATGADFFALTYGSSTDVRAMRYLRASYLLDWNGRGGAFIFTFRDRPDPYDPTWVRQLGPPLKPKFERAPGVWQRRYERGIVVVNTTGEAVNVRVNGTAWTIASTDALMAAAPR